MSKQLTTAERCAAIRTACAEYITQKEHNKEVEIQRQQDYQLARQDKAIYDLYHFIAKQLNKEFACEDRLATSNISTSGLNCSFFHEVCGLAYDRSLGWITVYLNRSYGKSCDIKVILDEKEETVHLDFAKLVTEFKRQHTLWEENYDQIAQECVKIITNQVKQYPKPFYGLPKEFSIELPGIFQKVPQHISQGIPLDRLAPECKAQLIQQMNSYIVHGRLDVCKNDEQWLHLVRTNSDTHQAQLLFDYQAVYSQYDVVTPALQEVFDHITEHPQPIPITEHFAGLKLQHKLFYCFDNEEKFFDEIRNRLSDKPHEASLMQDISNKLHIEVTQVKFERGYYDKNDHNTLYRHLTVTYELLPDQPELELYPDITVARITREIKRIRFTERQTMVNHLIDQALSFIEERILNDHYKPDDIDKCRVNLSECELKLIIDDYIINLKRLDEDYRQGLIESVTAQTEGMVKFDDDLNNFYITL